MTDYKAPLEDLLFILDKVLDYRRLFDFDSFTHADADVAAQHCARARDLRNKL